MHDLTLLSTLAGSLAAALVFGWVTQRHRRAPPQSAHRHYRGRGQRRRTRVACRVRRLIHLRCAGGRDGLARAFDPPDAVTASAAPPTISSVERASVGVSGRPVTRSKSVVDSSGVA